MIKEVLLIFKTHLDIGFTDYAKNVKQKYLESHIPNAIKLGYKLKDTDTPFVWTVGSWLMWEALKTDKSGMVKKAIEDGIISWHALPFTTHTEIMSRELFEYGLSLSERLDKMFNKKTIAAKMTDVPGHTAAIVPLMKKRGIELLHIGVNAATPMPNVLPIFKWCYDGEEIVVMYQSGYGKNMEIGEYAICFGHTLDNLGPQSEEDIERVYNDIRSKYPDAKIKAATLNDAVEIVREAKNLPCIEGEIGDTWIHGVGTDPKKLGRYRELLRYIEKEGIGDKDLSDNLLLVPEHTWGMDVKTFFHNDKDFMPCDFDKTKNDKQRKIIEESWAEQREYITKAEAVLGVNTDYTLSDPCVDGFTKINPDNISIKLSWQLFDKNDYERYRNDYMTPRLQNAEWALWDFTKFGLSEYEGGIHDAKVTAAYQNDEKLLYKLEFDKDISNKYGLGYFWIECKGEDTIVMWLDKKPLRLPNAYWIKFEGYKEDWQIRKLKKWFSPEGVLGSPLICATDFGVKNDHVEIETLDAALVAPFGRKLLSYDLNPVGQDLYFNLYNNIWNTNFPMWYSDNTRFRFKVKNV